MLTSETISTFLAGQKAVLLLTLVVNFWGLIALYRNSKNRPSDYALAVMLLGLLGWTGSITTLLVFAALPAAHLAFFSTTIALTGFAWFALVYPNETYKKKYFFLLIPGIIVAICALIPNFFINGLAVDAYGYLSLIRNKTLIGFSIYALFAGILPTYILFKKKYREQNTQVRQRLHWIATAALITFLGSFVTNVFLPNFLNFPYLNSIGPAFSMILAAIIVWITSTEHYVDSRNVFGVITGRLALAAATIIVFSSVSMLLALGSAENVVIHIVAATATAITIFVMGPSIRSFGESILQQKDRRNTELNGYTRGIFEALAPTTTVGEIETILGNIFSESFGISATHIILAEKASPDIAAHVAALAEIRTCLLNPPAIYITDALSVTMPNAHDPHRHAIIALAHALHAEVIVPVTHHHHIIGILALGNKRNGAGYTRKDAEMLASGARLLSPLLIRASIIEHADEVAHSLEENVAFRTRELKHTIEEERDISYRLAQKIASSIHRLEEVVEREECAQALEDDTIQDALSSAARAAEGLLAYTRGMSTPYTPSRTFDLSAMVNELIKNARSIASDERVEFRYEVADGAIIPGNATSIQNTLAAVIGNAFNYLEQTNRNVSIALSKNADQALFTVSDSGIGIPRPVIDRVGTPFFNAHPLHEVEQGVGLSLAIARSIITQHGGTMVITSELGKGTRVTIALPLAK